MTEPAFNAGSAAASMLAQLYTAFASPACPLDPAIAAMIARTHAHGVLNRTIEQLADRQAWFKPVAEDWMQLEPDLHAIWHPAFSKLDEELSTTGRPSTRCLIETALAMHESGGRAEWSATTSIPYGYRFGRYRIPAISHIGWSNNDPARPVLRDGAAFSFSGNDELERVRLDHNVLIDPHADLGTPKLPYRTGPAVEMRPVLADAFDMLDANAPQYALWSQRLLRTVVPLDAPAGHQISASIGRRRGSVMMSWRVRPDQMAEMLVHESSHQHFFLAGLLAPYDDGSDREVYYSPVVKTKRPLAKILLAYHAFANVILLFRLLRDQLGRNDRNWVDRESDKVMSELRQLEQPLRRSRALTELGHCLWRPLAAQVDEVMA